MTVGATALPRMAGVSAGGLRVSHKHNRTLLYLGQQELPPHNCVTKLELVNEEARSASPPSNITHI